MPGKNYPRFARNLNPDQLQSGRNFLATEPDQAAPMMRMAHFFGTLATSFTAISLVAACSPAAAREADSPANDLVARYTFDANAALIEPEATGFGPDAIVFRDYLGRPLSGREPGLLGRALRPVLRSKVLTSFPTDRAFTISLWIKPEKDDVSGFLRCDGFFNVGIRRGKAIVDAQVGDARQSVPIQLNTWHNIILRSDGAQVILLVDGKPAEGNPMPLPAGRLQDQPLVLANVGGAHHQFAGLVDEARIYNLALSKKALRQLSNPDRCKQDLGPTLDLGVDHTVHLSVPSPFWDGKSLEITARVSPDARQRKEWAIIQEPAAAQAVGKRKDDDTVRVFFSTPGQYVVQCLAKNDRGVTRDTVRVAVFSRPRSPESPQQPVKFFDNPLKPGTVGATDYKAMGKEAIYTPEFVTKHFAPLDFQYHLEGADQSRFSSPPPAYQHPRIFFDSTDLPDIRQRLRSTRAGRAALAKVRSLMELNLRNLTANELLPRYVTFNPDQPDKPALDYKRAAAYCSAAFIALIEADETAARRVIESTLRVADDQLRVMQAIPADRQTDWQNTYHGLLGRYANAYVYDFLYDWMTPAERTKLRQVIAQATQGKWSIGMYAANAHGRSNWLCWVTGDLLANILAIEGEQGYDPVVYQEAANAMQRFCNNGLYADGAMNEGMGKNAVTVQNLMAMAKRGDQTLFSKNVYNHAAKFLLHTMQPYGYQFIEDDLWGGSRKEAYVPDIVAIKYAYPQDPTIDFVYRNVVGDDYNWTASGTNYTYGSDLVACWTALDWQGDPDWNTNAQAIASETALDYHSNNINLVTARSGWQRDSALLYFLPRMQGGHPSPARGTFVYSALGRDWSLYPTGHNHKSSLQHSVISVDGNSASVRFGKIIAYESTPAMMTATCDLRDVYADHRDLSASRNSFRLRPSGMAWDDLPGYLMPHWYDGDKPGAAAPAEAATPNPVRAAYRTAMLVRPAAADSTKPNRSNPFALIVDDIQIDDQSHTYRWQMVLPPDLADTVEVTDNGATIVDPNTNRRLIVHLLDASKGTRGRLETLPDDLGRHRVLVFESEGIAAKFTVMLTAVQGKARPTAEPVFRAGILTVAGERFQFDQDASGRRLVTRLSQ